MMTDTLMMQRVEIITTKRVTAVTTTAKIIAMMTDCSRTLSPQKGSLQRQRRHSCGFVQTPPSHQTTACQHPCHTDWLPAAINTIVFRASFGLHEGARNAGGLARGMLMLLMLTVQCKALQVPWNVSYDTALSFLCLRTCKGSTRATTQVAVQFLGMSQYFTPSQVPKSFRTWAELFPFSRICAVMNQMHF